MRQIEQNGALGLRAREVGLEPTQETWLEWSQRPGRAGRNWGRRVCRQPAGRESLVQPVPVGRRAVLDVCPVGVHAQGEEVVALGGEALFVGGRAGGADAQSAHGQGA